MSNIIIDESKIMEAGILAGRARTVSNVLLNDYFSQDIKSKEDLWKLSGFYYETARTLVEIILNFTHDAEKIISESVDEAKIFRGGVL